MARTRRTVTAQINRPYQITAELQNNGTFYGYDRENKTQITEIPQQDFYFLDNTYFKYLLKIKKGKRETDLISTEYNRKDQKIALVDRIENTKAEATPEESAQVWGGGNTGIVIYALGAKDGVLYRLQGASSVLGAFKDFEKECADMPDFTISTQENQTGEGPKSNWIFEYTDLTPDQATTERLETATAALAEYYKAKGLYFDHLAPTNQEEE